MARALRQNKLTAASKKARRPIDLLLPYLGKRPDTWFAGRIGCGLSTVAAMRLAAKLPSYGQRCRLRLPVTTRDAEIDAAIAAYRASRRRQASSR